MTSPVIVMTSPMVRVPPSTDTEKTSAASPNTTDSSRPPTETLVLTAIPVLLTRTTMFPMKADPVWAVPDT